MISYRTYEKTVYDWLKAKRAKDSDFAFSLRLNGMKGAELDYFIGTERSRYFGTTFWSIPVFYPGSSSDLIDLIFGYSKNGHLVYHFEFKQTKSPSENQNTVALELIKAIREDVSKLKERFFSSGENSKIEWFKIKAPKDEYQDILSLFSDLNADLDYIIPIVNNQIAVFKSKFPDFKANRITNTEFENFEQRLQKRFQKYSKPQTDRTIPDENAKQESTYNTINQPLNQIFFGPPGTGKTYHTIDEAVQILSPDFYEQNLSDRKLLRSYFLQQLIQNWDNVTGQIAFCTFHQSFSYEDFVEGIKPLKPVDGDTHLKYNVEDGIFKRMCQLTSQNLKAQSREKSELISLSDTEFGNAQFYKLSLGDYAEHETKVLYDYWKENNVISIGFGDGIDFTGKNETEVTALYQEKYKDDFGSNAINLFKNYLKTGNYIVISKGNQHVRAIGKVTGEYFYDPTTEMRHKHFRKVSWIFNDQEIPVEDIYTKNLSQQTIYKMKSEWIQKSFFVNSTDVVFPEESAEPKNYVLIIDEINRGNVASIFGELITLIEPDKRAGNKEALEVVLPYSKERFSVPPNLYIIGTMNTADRSIEALDTALRRRFSFIEMAPDSTLIRTQGSLKNQNGMIDDIDVVVLLDTINNRIEKLIDKDHKIGHAYFMDLETKEDLELAFKDKVIPLLEEYFFGDYGKIGLVLGDSFVAQTTNEKFGFANFSAYDGQMTQDLADRSIYKIKPSNEWDFVSIYAQTIKS